MGSKKLTIDGAKLILKYLLLSLLYFGIHSPEVGANNSCGELQGEPKRACLRQNYVARAQSLRDRIAECDQMASSPAATESQIQSAERCLSRTSQILLQHSAHPADALIRSGGPRQGSEGENYCPFYVAHESLVQRAGGTRSTEAIDIIRVRDEQERLRRADRVSFERSVNICISSIERDPNFLMQIVELSEKSMGVVKTTQGTAPSALEPAGARPPARRGE